MLIVPHARKATSFRHVHKILICLFLCAKTITKQPTVEPLPAQALSFPIGFALLNLFRRVRLLLLLPPPPHLPAQIPGIDEKRVQRGIALRVKTVGEEIIRAERVVLWERFILLFQDEFCHYFSILENIPSVCRNV